jgi:hypothetical protein
MLDVIPCARPLPGGDADGHQLRYGQILALTRDKYGEAHDLIMKAG